jgi:hypothetical protein
VGVSQLLVCASKSQDSGRLAAVSFGRTPVVCTVLLLPHDISLSRSSAECGSAPTASPSACDAAYAAFSRATSPTVALDAAPFLAVTPANVLRLYACEDSSLCRAGCDDDVFTCARAAAGKSGCCYPLSDGSVWKLGSGLGVFSDFGCRGFSSWVKNRTAAAGAGAFLRGIEVEWAVPRGSALAKCADGAALVNATAVHNGLRCVCPVGLDGDGFALGTGCSNATRCKYALLFTSCSLRMC